MANRAKIYPDGATVETHIFLPGRVRNELARHCADLGTNMNEWCGVVIRAAVDEARGMPEPPPAAAPRPPPAATRPVPALLSASGCWAHDD